MTTPELAVFRSPATLLARNEQARILLVDDYPDSLELLAEWCAPYGCKLRVTCDATSAAIAAAELVPHLAIVDVTLPDDEGLIVARQLRARAETRDTWLVALTGLHDLRTRVLAAEAGFDEHMEKPFDFSRLTRLLRELVGGAGELKSGPRVARRPAFAQ